MNRLIRFFRNAAIVFSFFPLVTSAQNGSAGINYSVDSTIVVFGDTRTGHAVHEKIVECILKTAPSAVFNSGDLVWNGRNKKMWARFNAIEEPLLKSTKYYVAAGNHELSSVHFRKNFQLPGNGLWYAVNIGGIHFIVIDNTSDYDVGSEQYKWLMQDLISVPVQMRFKVVVMHYPAYTTGPHRGHCKKVQQTLVPLFEKYGVDIVFAAHNHGYERSLVNNVCYVTSAGGGAPLYNQKIKSPYSQVFINNYNFCTLKVTDRELRVTALDTAMKTIDEFVVVKK